jgi:hypothetical protein
MSADWNVKLQEIIELSRRRIRQLEAEASADSPSLSVEVIRQIEVTKKNIALLQRAIDALI